MLSAEDVLRLLPHRYPFLLIDGVREFEEGVRIVAVKNVTADEWFFAGGRPGFMAMPGLLVVEAMAQAGGVLLMAGAGREAATTVVYFAALNHVRWHAPVVPGDQLRLQATVVHGRGRLRKVRATAVVDGTVVCEADMSAVVTDR